MVQALVCGAGGFIGSHLVRRLKADGFWVRGRNSDNRLIHAKLEWGPTQPLQAGITDTYRWIAQQVHRNEPVNA
jgi:nucleoside-diphosphate-sugar epimerase